MKPVRQFLAEETRQLQEKRGSGEAVVVDADDLFKSKRAEHSGRRVPQLVRDAVEQNILRTEQNLSVLRADVQESTRNNAVDLLPKDHKFACSQPWATRFLDSMDLHAEVTVGARHPRGQEPHRIRSTAEDEGGVTPSSAAATLRGMVSRGLAPLGRSQCAGERSSEDRHHESDGPHSPRGSPAVRAGTWRNAVAASH